MSDTNSEAHDDKENKGLYVMGRTISKTTIGSVICVFISSKSSSIKSYNRGGNWIHEQCRFYLATNSIWNRRFSNFSVSLSCCFIWKLTSWQNDSNLFIAIIQSYTITQFLPELGTTNGKIILGTCVVNLLIGPAMVLISFRKDKFASK